MLNFNKDKKIVVIDNPQGLPLQASPQYLK